jgi:hypothetical protein
MGKMATTLDDKLPAFQKYLLEKNLAPANNVPFYAIGSAGFSISQEEMDFQRWNIRRAGAPKSPPGTLYRPRGNSANSEGNVT